MLKLVKLTKNQANLIKPIYKEAFPFKERRPFWNIKSSMKDKMELLALYDEDKLVGFGTCFVLNDLVYLDYLAMDKQYRGHGYGSEYLKQVYQYYQDKRLCLIMERVDEECSNLEQRIKRRAFYLNNGLKAINLYTSAISGNYEVLIHGGDLSGKEFISIMNYALGPIFKVLAKYHIVN